MLMSKKLMFIYVPKIYIVKTENYNYFYDETGFKIVINELKDYSRLPQMSAIMILKNNQYVREMQVQKLSCIPHDIISPDYNASGAMYILFSYILNRFDFFLSAEKCTEEQVFEYLQTCKKLIPELLYKAKYCNPPFFPKEKPVEPYSYMVNFKILPERIRFLFFLAFNHVNRYQSGISSCLFYVAKYLQLEENEGRACKNEFGVSLRILHDLFDTFSFPQLNS